MSVHATAIVSLANAKSRLFEAGSANDTAIEQMIDGFTALIEGEVLRPVKKRTITARRMNGTGDSWIIVPWNPVVSIAEFQIRNDDDDSVLATITDSAQWILKDPDSGLVKLVNDVFAEGRRNILFTGAVGFEATDIRFRDFEEAMYIALSDYYPRWQRKETSVVQKSYPDGSATLIPPSALPPTVRQRISKYVAAMGVG